MRGGLSYHWQLRGQALITGEEDKALEPKHVGIFLS
jgi:hypothetical protein